jgi:hypothetical protein
MRTKKSHLHITVPSLAEGQVWASISGNRVDIISLFHSTYGIEMPKKLHWTEDEVFTLEYEFCKKGVFRALKNSKIPF